MVFNHYLNFSKFTQVWKKDMFFEACQMVKVLSQPHGAIELLVLYHHLQKPSKNKDM